MATEVEIARKNVLGRRAFLSDEIPFLLGRNPGRVAPAHVANAFLREFFGRGVQSDALREFMRGDGSELPGVSRLILAEPTKRVQFKEGLRTIFDPDHRVFPTEGSPFPLHCSFLSDDPSDDGYGRELAMLVAACEPSAAEALSSALVIREDADAVSIFADILAGGGEQIAKLPTGAKWAWATGGGRVGKLLAENLASLVIQVTKLPFSNRSALLVALERAVYLAVFLGVVRSAPLMAKQPKGWNALTPIFYFGGQPPGDHRSAAVRLAIRSFDQAVAELYESLALRLRSRLASQRLPKRLPESQQKKVLLKTAFASVPERQLTNALRLVGRTKKLDDMADRLRDVLYPPGYIASSLRSLGRMVGVAGPDRGFGSPRFVLETPLLGVLVSISVPPTGSMALEDWIDNIYEKFGIVLGRGRAIDATEVLAKLDEPALIHRAVEENQEALRLRLLRAGLAIEYSDGETEVIGLGRQL